MNVDTNTLRPGELIVFHGLTRGSRGVCLVVSALPHQTPEGVYQCREVTVLSQHLKFYTFLDEDPEEVFWSRISEALRA